MSTISRPTSPNFSNSALPTVTTASNTETHQAKADIQDGLTTTAQASKETLDSLEMGPAIEKGKGKAKEGRKALSQVGSELAPALSRTASNLADARRSAAGVADAAVEGAENLVDSAAEQAPAARRGLAQAGTGVFNLVKKPVIWVANKTSAMGTNLREGVPSERFGAKFAAALALGGTAAFAAAAAASWSATLFVNLPTLALGTALLGATLLGYRLLTRAFTTPEAPNTTQGVVAKGARAHRAIVEMNDTCEAAIAKLTTEKSKFDTKTKQVGSKLTLLASEHARYVTRADELQKEIDILNVSKRTAADAVTVEEATPIDVEALLKTVKAKVEAFTTTSDKTEVRQSKVVTDLTVEGQSSTSQTEVEPQVA